MPDRPIARSLLGRPRLPGRSARVHSRFERSAVTALAPIPRMADGVPAVETAVRIQVPAHQPAALATVVRGAPLLTRPRAFTAPAAMDTAVATSRAGESRARIVAPQQRTHGIGGRGPVSLASRPRGHVAQRFGVPPHGGVAGTRRATAPLVATQPVGLAPQHEQAAAPPPPRTLGPIAPPTPPGVAALTTASSRLRSSVMGRSLPSVPTPQAGTLAATAREDEPAPTLASEPAVDLERTAVLVEARILPHVLALALREFQRQSWRAFD